MKVDLFTSFKNPNSCKSYYIHYHHPASVIHSDMVYDPEHTTGLYQREPQILWIVISSSECYIWTHTDSISEYMLQVCYVFLYVVAISLIVCQNAL